MAIAQLVFTLLAPGCAINHSGQQIYNTGADPLFKSKWLIHILNFTKNILWPFLFNSKSLSSIKYPILLRMELKYWLLPDVVECTIRCENVCVGLCLSCHHLLKYVVYSYRRRLIHLINSTMILDAERNTFPFMIRRSVHLLFVTVQELSDVALWHSSNSLQWRHNERDGVSNRQLHDCLLIRLFRRRLKKTSKLRFTSLCEGDSLVTGEFLAQRASNAENVSIWRRHHVSTFLYEKPMTREPNNCFNNHRPDFDLYDFLFGLR